MNTQEIILKHVCPGLGCGIALIMFCSPLPAVLRANRAKSLGELNALPFAAMCVNCTAWVFYALLLTDWYIYFGNLPGMLLGLFYVLTCYKFSKEAAQDMLRNLLISAIFLYWLMGFVSMAASLSDAATKTLWGATSVAVLGVYYVAPLSSVAKVIAERDSSSLHWPLCSMNIVNGMLWFAYGLALKDWFVCLPNGIGAGFNVVCLIMCFVFPARRKQQQGQQPGQLLDELNPGANWGALRLQSIARPPPGSPAALAAAAAGGSSGGGGGGGFFDLTQLRWRTSQAFGSFRGGSFLRMLSSSQRSSTADGLAGPAAAGGVAAAGAGGTGTLVSADSSADVGRGLGQEAEGDVAGVKKAGTHVGDVEQAHVVADSSRIGVGDDQQLQQQQACPASVAQQRL